MRSKSGRGFYLLRLDSHPMPNSPVPRSSIDAGSGTVDTLPKSAMTYRLEVVPSFVPVHVLVAESKFEPEYRRLLTV